MAVLFFEVFAFGVNKLLGMLKQVSEAVFPLYRKKKGVVLAKVLLIRNRQNCFFHTIKVYILPKKCLIYRGRLILNIADVAV